MTTRKLNRRDFIGGLSQSVLSLLVLSRATQQLVASASQPTSVLVLGAGLSGLYTALLLEAKGLSVTVTAISSPGMESALESAERVAQEILSRIN